jgi:hypothetical protein
MRNEIMPLPIRFQKNGFLYWQVCRTDKAAIYEQRMPDGRQVFYEVWQIRRRPSYRFDGKQYPESERGPGTQDWGRYGWTYYTLPEARKRYDQINGWSAVINSFSPDENDTRNETSYTHIYPGN